MSIDLDPEPHVHVFDARGVARRLRHAAIFGALGSLRNGETMRFINDHDPLPLLAQLDQRFGELLTVVYRQRSEQGVVIDFSMTGLPEP
ncbi:MAG: DUF2249 domain-containing protein [Gammaproteobacteria bacterium]|nr:DUF2249 domain-containing protein [Gammaproteobacteria bacterium]